MPSFSIHLAIGKRYIEKNNGLIKDINDFFKGIIEPDLVENKYVSHYTVCVSTSNLLQCIENKVHLEKFLKNEKINTDYQKGVFLHLLTDYLFFNNFFDKEYISNVSYDIFCKDLYYSYNSLNNYVDTKYDLDYSEFIDVINKNIEENNKKRHLTYEEGNNILLPDKLDDFIEYVSNIDLIKYSNKIMDANKNVLPD